MNPWPTAIKLVIGLAITLAVAVTLQRVASRSANPGESPYAEPELRLAAFNDVYEDLEEGTAQPRAWRQPSGRIIFPGIAMGECSDWVFGQTPAELVNEEPWRSAGNPPLEKTFAYARVYNDTLKNILLNRYGVCATRLLRRP